MNRRMNTCAKELTIAQLVDVNGGILNHNLYEEYCRKIDFSNLSDEQKREAKFQLDLWNELEFEVSDWRVRDYFKEHYGI